MFPISLRWLSSLAPPVSVPERRWIATVALALSCSTALADNSRIYVNAAAPPDGDGASWAAAFHDLQDAIAAAESREGPDTIWVAQGIYKPDQKTLNSAVGFVFASQVSVYGGFRGDETSLAERPNAASGSVLSGDLFGDDHSGGTLAENTLWLVATGTGAALSLDSFTIEGAAQNSLLCQSSSLLLTNCTFGAGGGVRIDRSDWAAERCNWLPGSEGVVAFIAFGGTTPGRTHSLRDCAFDQATLSITDVNAGPGSVVLERCSFANASEPVVMRVFHAEVRDCVFRSNAPVDRPCIQLFASRSGAQSPNDHSTVLVDGCRFVDNACGGLSVYSTLGSERSRLQVSDCRFANNNSNVAPLRSEGYAVEIEHSTFMHNYRVLHGGSGGAVELIGAQAGGFVRFCDFIGNSGARSGGAIAGYSVPFNALPIVNCRFIGNVAEMWGGAVDGMSGPFINCVFAQNEAYFGSAVDGIGGSSTPRSYLVNCTIVKNFGSPTIGISNLNYLDNCIVFGNVPRNGDRTFILESSTVPRHSNVQVLFPPFTNGNFNAPPEFVNPTAFDYRLRPTSPCIGTGGTDLLPSDLADIDADGDSNEPLPLDLAHEPRVLGTQVDVGVYEFARFIGDVNWDGVISTGDVAPFVLLLTDPAGYAAAFPACDPFSGDMNANGVVNVADIGGFVALLTER